MVNFNEKKSVWKFSVYFMSSNLYFIFVLIFFILKYSNFGDELGWNSPSNDSVEDNYIVHTSMAPSLVYSRIFPQVLSGSSIEYIINDLIKKTQVCSYAIFFSIAIVESIISKWYFYSLFFCFILLLIILWLSISLFYDSNLDLLQNRIINGEDSLCIDPINNECLEIDAIESSSVFDQQPLSTKLSAIPKDPPAIQVDMPSGWIMNHWITNHPNCFFYLSTLSMTLQPIIVLRVLQHRMFGSISYWTLNSRASVASSAASSYDCNRSRTNSNASNFDRSNFFSFKHQMDWHCSNFSLSPNRIDMERRLSSRG